MPSVAWRSCPVSCHVMVYFSLHRQGNPVQKFDFQNQISADSEEEEITE